MTLETVRWTGNRLELLDQRRLPQEVTYQSLSDLSSILTALRSMVVRGTPAVGVTAAFAVALVARRAAMVGDPLKPTVLSAMDALAAARPTGAHLFNVLDRLRLALEEMSALPPVLVAARLELEAARIQTEGIAANRALSAVGVPLIEHCSGILTHGNPGALGTAGFGTALGILRLAWKDGRRFMVYVGETRPYLQGGRLTVWELGQEHIPVTLMVDAAAAALMASGRVQAVLVGADRIAANGDVAAKVGTYGLALLARAHHIPFIVAAPTETFDLAVANGQAIPIEQRPSEEVTHLAGTPIAADPVDTFNPGFDVTPASFVTKMVTEVGVLEPEYPDKIAEARQKGREWVKHSVLGS